MLPEPKKSPSSCWANEAQKSDTFQENWSKSWKPDMFHVKAEIRVGNWCDSTLVNSAYGWSIYLGGHFPNAASAELGNTQNSVQPWFHPHYVLPVASLCLNRSASHAAARGLKWVLTCKNTRLTRHMVRLLWEHQETPSIGIHQYTRKHTCSSSIKAAKKKVSFGIYPLKQKSRMRIWTCKSAHPVPVQWDYMILWYY